jgi:hypothetical protein
VGEEGFGEPAKRRIKGIWLLLEEEVGVVTWVVIFVRSWRWVM